MEGNHYCLPPEPTDSRSLVLDQLELDPEVARRLSPDTAARHHVLPVAAQHSRVTVAMADPTDEAVIEAVTGELGIAPYIVQGDQRSIDDLLAELQRGERGDDSHFLVSVPDDAADSVLGSYAGRLSGLLNASLHYLPRGATISAVMEDKARHFELVIRGRRAPALARRRPHGSASHGCSRRLDASQLIVPKPRWPLRKLLLVVQGGLLDHKATDWSLRLATASGAWVTVLAVVPPIPAMYCGLPGMGGGLAELLTMSTPLGREMRQVARRLVDRNVDGTLRLRQGPFDLEIQRELVEGRFDMLLIAAASRDGARRWLSGNPAMSLTRVLDRPMLVAA